MAFTLNVAVGYDYDYYLDVLESPQLHIQAEKWKKLLAFLDAHHMSEV